MSQPYLGEILLFGGTFAPVDFLKCEGQLVLVADYPNLAQLLGTTYGGDGTTNFGIPDLRGRVPIHRGQGRNLPNYTVGQMDGAEAVTLSVAQMAMHNHVVMAASVPGNANTPDPAGKSIVARLGEKTEIPAWLKPGGASQTQLRPASTSMSGGNQPHSNIQPSTAITYIICVQGAWPQSD